MYLLLLVLALGLTGPTLAGAPPGPAPATHAAAIHIAVFPFGLDDTTLLPGVPAERRRTAAVAPYLRAALADRYGYTVVEPPLTATQAKEMANGALYRRPAPLLAAARQSGADFAVAGLLVKPTYLFSFLVGNLFDLRTGRSLGERSVRIEGPMSGDRVTAAGAERLAAILHEIITPARATAVPANKRP
jgi:hypothetical protein